MSSGSHLFTLAKILLLRKTPERLIYDIVEGNSFPGGKPPGRNLFDLGPHRHEIAKLDRWVAHARRIEVIIEQARQEPEKQQALYACLGLTSDEAVETLRKDTALDIEMSMQVSAQRSSDAAVESAKHAYRSMVALWISCLVALLAVLLSAIALARSW